MRGPARSSTSLVRVSRTSHAPTARRACLECEPRASKTFSINGRVHSMTTWRSKCAFTAASTIETTLRVVEISRIRSKHRCSWCERRRSSCNEPSNCHHRNRNNRNNECLFSSRIQSRATIQSLSDWLLRSPNQPHPPPHSIHKNHPSNERYRSNEREIPSAAAAVLMLFC